MPIMNGRPSHPFAMNERVARAFARRLVLEGRDVGPRRQPPTTPEELEARLDAATAMVLARNPRPSDPL